jgi:hypothetical protein
LFIFLISLWHPLSGKSSRSDTGILNPLFAGSSPVIDGRLDYEIWQESPLSENFITYDQAYGEILPQKTEVWIAYDKQNLYFAFKCYDSEPGTVIHLGYGGLYEKRDWQNGNLLNMRRSFFFKASYLWRF